MSIPRSAVRCSTALRVARPLRPLRQRRFQNTSSGNSSQHSHSRTALYGGLAGGAIAVTLGYSWYSFSGAKQAVGYAHQAKSYFDSSKNKLQQVAPEPNEALDWLRKQTSFYASFVPGGKQYVDTVFHDLDTVREQHGDEVDKIVKEAYEELKDITNKDLSVSTATEAWSVLQKHLGRLTDLASDSAHEILANHPQLQQRIGTNVDQLRSLGKSLGPDAEKIASDTWSQVQGIIAGGLSAGSIGKLEKLINEKTEHVKQMGDKAWSKGVGELKPFLDKNPEIKEMLESNKSALLRGNLSELWNKAKESSQSGNVEDLKNYVQRYVDKGKQKSGDLSSMAEKYIDEIFPGAAGQLLPKFNQFKEMLQDSDTRGMEQLVKETVDEVKELLEKKVNEGKKLVGSTNKDSK